ncbi:MAG TPA: CoA transferase [Candidatus Cybelea sp.]|nr:CoA transferase [Candidatus Cybelea sp.]
MGGALFGIRVLDFTRMLAGPYCTRLFADLGAEVIKIEPPEGDHIRHAAPVRDGRSAYFGQLNCGKKSIAVDLAKPEGRALVHALVRKADVVIENFRPGVARRIGIGYETLRALKPDLVYASISGFGQSGPGAERPAYAPIVHAASGYDLVNLAYQTGGETRPANTGANVADVLSGALAASAIQSALLHRERTGQGQMVDVALMDAMISLMPYDAQAVQFPNNRARPIYVPLQASDGFVVVAPVTASNFADMCRAVARPEWIEDPRYATGPERARHWLQLMAQVEDWTRARTASACETAFRAAGCPAARYATLSEALGDAQLAHRGMLVDCDDGAGPFKVTNSPYRLSETQPQAAGWVPRLGQHNREICEGLLGMAPDEIAALENAGILAHEADRG